MGCHTWFYRKIERTQEEATIRCLKRLKRHRNLYWKIHKNPNYLDIDWEISKADNLNRIRILNRQIKAISNGFYKKALWNRQDDKNLTKFIEGKGLYIEDTGYHDIFRKYGYPEDRLFSLEETLEYINNPINECDLRDSSIDRLTQFWQEYPEGIICFG